MFDALYTDAYNKLKCEIVAAAGRLLIEADEENNDFDYGRLHEMNEVVDIMNKVDKELYNSLLREVEKEAAYYETEITAHESRSEKL